MAYSLEFQFRKVYVQRAPLVDAAKVCLLPYIMLGLDKNFVKAMHHQGEGFKHSDQLFFYTIDSEV